MRSLKLGRLATMSSIMVEQNIHGAIVTAYNNYAAPLPSKLH